MPVILLAKLIGEVVKLTIESATEAAKLANELDKLGEESNSNNNGKPRFIKTEHYEGTVVGKTPQGYGTMKYISRPGNVYSGEFVDGLMDGNGTFKWASGYKYQGSWKQGKRNGFGTLFNADGVPIYVGEWANDMRNGQGSSFNSTSISYMGTWKDDARHGTGKHYWPDGFMCLEGEFEKGIIAKGKFYYSPTQHPKQYGNFFEGTFKEWKFSYGVLTKKDGTRYEGGFLEGKYEGQGTLHYPENDPHDRITFIGNFSKGYKQGLGKDITKKAEYEGPYENNARHGNGVLRFKSGNVYEGPFVGGHMCGKGILKLPSGGKYEATWVNSVKEGEAIFTSPSGKQETHVFKAGVRIDNKK